MVALALAAVTFLAPAPASGRFLPPPPRPPTHQATALARYISRLEAIRARERRVIRRLRHRLAVIDAVGVTPPAPPVAPPQPAAAPAVDGQAAIFLCIHAGEGAWSANSGNGYYGGLQFSLATWDAAGGQQYAALPSDATPPEQIMVAEYLVNVLGASYDQQWPVTAPRCGV